MIKRMVQYEATTGELFTNFNDAVVASGFHVCPKCNGRGSVEVIKAGEWGYTPDTIKDEVCDVCNGKGYTLKKLKPVTKIVGYE